MMKAPIIEIFSSFQGEGLLIGERQILLDLQDAILIVIIVTPMIVNPKNQES